MSSVGTDNPTNDALNNVKYQMIENMLKVVLTQLSVERNQLTTKNEIAPGFSGDIPFHVPFRTPYAAPKDILLEIKQKYQPLPVIEDPLKEPHILNPMPPYEGFKTPLDPGILSSERVSCSFDKNDNLCFPIRCVDGYLTIPLTEDEFYDLLLGKEVRLQTNIHLQCYCNGHYLKVPAITKLPAIISKGMISTARGVFHRAAMFYFCMVHNLIELNKWNITYREDKITLISKFYEKPVVSLPFPQFEIRYLDHSYLTEMKYIHYCILICKYYSTLAQQLIAFTEVEQPIEERTQLEIVEAESLVKTDLFTCVPYNSEFEVASTSGTEMSDPPEDPRPLNMEERPEENASFSLETYPFPSGQDSSQQLNQQKYFRSKKVESEDHPLKQEISQETRILPSTSRIPGRKTQPVSTIGTPDEVQSSNVANPSRLEVDEKDFAAALFLSSLKSNPLFAARPTLPTIGQLQRKRRKTTVEGRVNSRTAPKKTRQY